jgi:hypothetical protein
MGSTPRALATRTTVSRVAENVAIQVGRQPTERPDPALAEKLRVRLGRK